MTTAAPQVDRYIAERLLGDDSALEAALAANEAAGLPAIDVSAPQGAMLGLLTKLIGARRVLEVGTLGGYSTICLARALPEGGKVVTLEIDPRHAEVARSNLDHAGVSERVEIRVGPALDTLQAMIAAAEGAFDLVFIDADKESNADYVRAAIALGRPGTAIIVDNVVRDGRVLDAASKDAMIQGTRRLFDYLHGEVRLDATAIQTVGSKGWDGFVIARIKGAA
ncbi:MAG: O-methyltransferase [Novosphingobium sp.]|nr:O-methyltransferase [Novosphingobium sp.]